MCSYVDNHAQQCRGRSLTLVDCSDGRQKVVHLMVPFIVNARLFEVVPLKWLGLFEQHPRVS